jgi:hypothetical protein
LPLNTPGKPIETPIPNAPEPDRAHGYPKTLYHVITDPPGYTAVTVLNLAAFDLLYATGEWAESAEAAQNLGKPASTYPKLKYQFSDQPPGFTYARVETPEQESALTGTWYDTPAAANAAHSGGAHAQHAAKPAEEPEPPQRSRR